MPLRTFAIFLLIAQLNSIATSQETLYIDNFEEDSVIAPFGASAHGGNRSVENGQWVLQPSFNGSGVMSGHLSGLGTDDHTVRTQVSMLDEPEGDWTFLGIYGRWQSGGYWGGVGSDGRLFIGYDDGNINIVDSRDFSLDASVGVNLRLDILEDEIKLWGWPTDTLEPLDPQLTMTDTRFEIGDGAGIIYNPRSTSNTPRAAFGFFEVTTVPEPSGTCSALVGFLLLYAGLRRRDWKAGR